ncbi:MAG: hypothetical protein IPK82_40410 [Polyangiaceae bacterium]|nr:hypothetical protein [Polyangiaceae bacterium]
MDPPSRREGLRAPGVSGQSVHAYAPGSGASRAAEQYPALNAHLVKPEVTRDEVVRGRRVEALPALPEHGDPHFRLDYVIGAHVKAGYIGSTDMITRFSNDSNFATDTSIRKVGSDPKTGERYLEEVAFEVVFTQSDKDIRVRAQDLTARGVRRVFAIFVKRGAVAEWSAARGRFVDLPADGAIEDETFVAPVPVRALLNAAHVDDGVALALLAKNNTVLAAAQQAQLEKGREEGREQGREQGREEGLQAALLTVLSGRNLPVGAAALESIRSCKNTATLERWLKKALVVNSAEELISSRRR